jgi:hypothetical protein
MGPIIRRVRAIAKTEEVWRLTMQETPATPQTPPSSKCPEIVLRLQNGNSQEKMDRMKADIIAAGLEVISDPLHPNKFVVTFPKDQFSPKT